jgi:anti-sigma factor (TIGR02949 family)
MSTDLIPPPEECASIRAELGAWIDGELPREDRYRLERHLDACPACRAELELLQLVTQSVREMPHSEPGEAMRQQLLAQVRAEANRTRSELFIAEDDRVRVIREHGGPTFDGEDHSVLEQMTAVSVEGRFVSWQGWDHAGTSCYFIYTD